MHQFRPTLVNQGRMTPCQRGGRRVYEAIKRHEAFTTMQQWCSKRVERSGRRISTIRDFTSRLARLASEPGAAFVISPAGASPKGSLPGGQGYYCLTNAGDCYELWGNRARESLMCVRCKKVLSFIYYTRIPKDEDIAWGEYAEFGIPLIVPPGYRDRFAVVCPTDGYLGARYVDARDMEATPLESTYLVYLHQHQDAGLRQTEFLCIRHGVFEVVFSYADYQERARDVLTTAGGQPGDVFELRARCRKCSRVVGCLVVRIRAGLTPNLAPVEKPASTAPEEGSFAMTTLVDALADLRRNVAQDVTRQLLACLPADTRLTLPTATSSASSRPAGRPRCRVAALSSLLRSDEPCSPSTVAGYGTPTVTVAEVTYSDGTPADSSTM